MASPSLTILIPCLNEELGVASVIREYAEAFPQADILLSIMARKMGPQPRLEQPALRS